MATELSKFIPNYVFVKFIFVSNYHPGIINVESEERLLSSVSLVCVLLTVKPMTGDGPLYWKPRATGPLLKTTKINASIFCEIKSEKVSEKNCPDSANLNFDMLMRTVF